VSRARRLLASTRLQGIIVVLVALVAIGFTVDAESRQAAYQRCANRTTNQLVAALQARTQLFDRRDDATDTFFNEVFASTSREQTLAAYQHWLATRKQIDDELHQHPLPEPPSEHCG